MRRTSVGGAAGDWVGGAILDALFTQSPVGLHILDTELRVVRVNAAARGMRGVAVEGLVGLHFAEAYAGLAAPDEVEAMLRGVLESGVPVREHLLCMRVAAEQGREKCGSVSVFRLQDPQGTVLGLAVTAVDVTEQEQARARLRVLNAVRERVGQTLDVIATCQELVEALVPGFADAAMVDIVDAVVHGEESPTGPLAEDVALRRAAFRARDGLQVPSYPVADMRSLNLLRPYAQAMSDLRPRLVPLSPDTSWLDASRARGVRAAGAHTLIVAPLALRGTALGVLSLIRTDGSDPYDEDDVGLAVDVASHTALCIDNARRFTREYTIASTLQRHQLPRYPASHSTVETAHLHVPRAGGGGGGWFDSIPLSGARTALVVGEVAGSGIQAATTMGQLRTVIRCLAAMDLQPDELLARLNDTAVFLAAERAALPPGDALHRQPFSASCVYAVYDPVTRTCTFARAGRTPPVIIRPDSSTEVPDSNAGPVLGGAEGPPFAATTTDLPHGSTLALYTPAIWPAPPAESDGAPALLRDVLAQPGRPLLKDLRDDILRTLRNKERPGDAVLLLARTRPFPAHSLATWLLDHDPTAAATARGHTRRTLADWNVDEDTAYAAELIVSELVTNAIRYGAPPMQLRLIKDRTLTCEVHDDSATSPRLRHARTVDEGGRGLFIVVQLAQRWGTRYTAEGKTVWSEQALNHSGLPS
ncbi:SpoIIE family protein phosphatase [Streptomyces sp. NBC_00121]|nr:SpoIIE family protein phosphatase [Streptomyces sp. NBC_01760]WTI92217.1 SpoIIE family protein phosphatase [Streptomyces sp. NBC_00724]